MMEQILREQTTNPINRMMEQRRLKKKISTRESARSARRRKQERLANLELQVEKVANDLAQALNEHDQFKKFLEVEVANHNTTKKDLEEKDKRIKDLEKINEEVGVESASFYEAGFTTCYDQIGFLLPGYEVLNQVSLFKIIKDGQLVMNPELEEKEEVDDNVENQNGQGCDEAPN